MESEALAADIFNICSYNELVCNRSLASFNLASLEVREFAPEAATLDEKPRRSDEGKVFQLL